MVKYISDGIHNHFIIMLEQYNINKCLIMIKILKMMIMMILMLMNYDDDNEEEIEFDTFDDNLMYKLIL